MHYSQLILIGTVFLPSIAFAADIGTYRPGNSYMSLPAQNPDQCISYCNGDAQCKGWNFVKLHAAQSICEFNARDVAPIASPVSISGSSLSARPVYSGKSTRSVIPTGGSVTRVGQMSSPAERFSKPHQTRQIVKNGVPKPDPRHQIANYRSRLHSIETPKPAAIPAQPLASHHVQRPKPRLMPQLDALPPQSIAARAINHSYHTLPKYQPLLDNVSPPPQISARTTVQPDMQVKTQPPSIQAENLGAIPKLSQMPENSPRSSLESALAGGPIAGSLPPSSSLYGSLYDDVKRPKSLTAGDIPKDLDAPIATVMSVPVQKTETSPY